MKRYSKQREVILKLLEKRKDHPTVDELYVDVKKELPQVGIATVYRNLSELSKEGYIIRIKTRNGGPDRYDADITPHIHFECQNCQKIYDIFPNDIQYQKLNDNIKDIAQLIEAEATNTNIIITGICKNCLEK